MPSTDPAGSVAHAETLAEVFLAPFMKLAAVQPGERLLDVLAGSGEAIVEAARRAGETGEALALAPTAEGLDAVLARARREDVSGLRTAVMDAARLDLPASYWDVVICHLGLTELSEVEATLKEMLRVLRPVGRVTLSVLGERERCPLITMFLDAVGQRAPSAASEGRALFRYSETGRLAHLLADLGFEDAVPHRDTAWVPFAGVDDYWDFVTTLPRLRTVAASLSPADLEEAKADLERRTRFYRRGSGIELKVEGVVLAAVK